MNEVAGVKRIGWLALLWCAAWSGDLIAAWIHAPYDRLGAVAALAWSLAFGSAARTTRDLSGFWLFAGGVASFVGVAGELNVAQHAALAMVAAAIVGGRSKGYWLLFLAVGWMPALGWAMRWAGPVATNLIRLLDSGIALGLAWRWRRAL